MTGGWIVPGYRHVRRLGSGAGGVVEQAESLDTGASVAIKYLTPELLRDDAFRERFREEARILARIRNPYLVRFIGYRESQWGAAIVMELVDGVSLAAVLSHEGPLEPESALFVLKGSLEGLAAAHASGIVHRDYKPANVLVDGNGESKLGDFGVAVYADQTVPVAGTPAYMPPEQWGGEPVTTATDVYAATAVFYECLTGRQPFRGDTLAQLALAHGHDDIPMGDVPEPLRGLVAHGLAKDPAARPPTARDFVAELEETAHAAYGIGWEERGREGLKERALLLALLFPLSGGTAPVSGSEVATTSMSDFLGDGDAAGTGSGGRGLVRNGALVGLALLVLVGGGATVKYAAFSSHSKAHSGGGTSALPSPSTPASAGPVGDPSTPGDSPTASPSGTATPSAGPTNPAPGGPGGPPPPAAQPTTTTAPSSKKPKGGTTAPATKPPKTSPPPSSTPTPATAATGIKLSVSAASSRELTGTATVFANGTGPISVTITWSGNGTSTSSTDSYSGATSYSISLTHVMSGGCDTTWTVTAVSGSATNTGSTSYPCGVD